MKIVHIKWRDAASLGNWRSIKAVKEFIQGELDKVETVGMLVHEDESKITLIQTAGVNAVIGLFEIPKGCITEIREIGLADAELEL